MNDVKIQVQIDGAWETLGQVIEPFRMPLPADEEIERQIRQRVQGMSIPDFRLTLRGYGELLDDYPNAANPTLIVLPDGTEMMIPEGSRCFLADDIPSSHKVDLLTHGSDEQLSAITPEILASLLADRDPSVREAAIRALPKVRPAS